MRSHSKFLSAAVLVALAACGGAESADGAAEAESVGAPIEVPEISNGELLGLSRDRINMTLPWGTGRIARDPAPGAASPTLTTLDLVTSSAFDRMVFEFSADAPYPGYSVEWATAAIEGCSDSVGTAGSAILRVTFEPIMLTDENGRATVAASTNAGFDRLKTARQVCEMEGMVVFELAASTATEFRVLEMNQPGRLVVDLRAGTE